MDAVPVEGMRVVLRQSALAEIPELVRSTSHVDYIYVVQKGHYPTMSTLRVDIPILHHLFCII